MAHRTTESRYASKHDCPVGDVVFGGFAPSPMGSIRQTPEQVKEAEEFWRKANEARAKAAAKLRAEIAGTWLDQSEQILKEEIERAGTAKTSSALAQEDGRGHASINSESSSGTNSSCCRADGERCNGCRPS